MEQSAAVQNSPVLSLQFKEFDRRASLIAAAVSAGLAVFAAILLNAPEIWFLAGAAVLAIVLMEPRFGLYGSILTVGLDTASFDPLMAPFSPVFRGIPGLTATPLELLILATVAGWLARAISTGRWLWPDRYIIGSVVALVLLLLVAIEHGVSRGGDSIAALWEVRAFLILAPLILVTNGLLTERRHLYELAAVVVSMLLLLTVAAFWRYLAYVRPGDFQGAIEFAFSHETSVLVGLLMVAGICWALWGPNRKQRLIALAVALLAAIVLLTMRRRAGLIAGEAGLLLVGAFLLIRNWRVFLLFLPVVIIAGAAYLAVFWNNDKSLGQPARAFRTVFDSESVSERDRASDEYREAEAQNVWWNIQAAPVQGIGFGQPYAKPLPFPDLSSFWPFWDYIPHNTVLWLWMKAGVFAFLTFWFLLGSAVSQTTSFARRATDPWFVTAATVLCAYFLMVTMFSYVDLGLTSPRLMVLLGVFLGLVTVIQRHHPEPGAAPAAVTSRGATA